jgi:hypothetical protein
MKELDDFYAKEIRPLLRHAEEYIGYPVSAKALKPTVEGCRWCRCRAHCPALQDSVAALVQISPQSLRTPDRLARALGLAEMAENWAASAKANLKALAEEYIREYRAPPKVEGWEFFTETPQQAIADVAGACSYLESKGVSPSEYTEVYYGKARDALAKKVKSSEGLSVAKAKAHAVAALSSFTAQKAPRKFWRRTHSGPKNDPVTIDTREAARPVGIPDAGPAGDEGRNASGSAADPGGAPKEHEPC